MSANTRGGMQKALVVTHSHSHESKTMLKEDFLKKTENYSLQVQQFYTTNTAPINTLEGVLVEIIPLELLVCPARYVPEDYQFRGTFDNVSTFVREFQWFLHRF